MEGGENIVLGSNAAAGNGSDKTVQQGGRYLISVQSTGIGAAADAVTIQHKNIHGDYLTLGTAFTAIGTQAMDIPPGVIRAVFGTATSANYVYATRIAGY